MALDTYANLKTTLQTWLARADLANDVDDMIDMFEAWFNRNMRMPQMEQQSFTNAAEYLAFPSDFMELRDIQYQSAHVVQLDYLTPINADLANPDGSAGTPQYYTIVANQIRLIPPPQDTTVVVRIDYWQKIPALSGTNTSNWLLALFPDAYLYGSLVHGHLRVKDVQMAAAIGQGWGEIMKELERGGKARNVGSLLRMRPA